MKIDTPTIDLFKKTVWDFYKINRRDLLWRNTDDPYLVLVSEIMLQQTQVARVLIKYPIFILQFPNFKQLAKASIKDILHIWQGMGYNRRALYLKKIADIVIKEYNGYLPDSPHILETFPGIGQATASSIAAFAFNKTTVFIETNIRRVYLHHFFKGKTEVHDREIYKLVQKTLDTKSPREWYFALMDYGSYLGKAVENPNKRSRHYIIQSKFEGSDRQIRGKILKLLLKNSTSEEDLFKMVDKDPHKIKKILQVLVKEQFINFKNNKYYINNF
ncbi:hypothetical protein A2334_03970 [Candidatus Roizmanbacteria bacterium RIFOXYB2_FULL_38_10]|uniref:HhH-GPD domain-containing protein n=1 Tax=Candidatus Roizmanbacteria bacterium RIFOXYD1_FULL_38_12 TaxID=1802093 RepID=A0A1F7KZ77_9BACT|nr:MAG: hypothetical protein A3K47_00080 [Candidatus Roizmanbacteria bacterium RIFOXYA2_FULL_38_14]OGK63199.1 MAG: hypothetical protein A3K27_00080 [Candidatus Roizmanbacteria bacterium RIFOXYA1_FULL_37_12]OGK65045.1 MAG: hypothetical protein A3K38_00080 [Candidatus Roizmanbacteria bacterium RIFOXYB1_FULL_40_23]OGK68600.1 MAG: hypothetical protein A2334_03970 [Candidatus Roizmanbacteria bacterium RIFOXYB2_FULL_38_10]OGK69448.1 MAG: hypothetical protein A3K21_00080 [Candidatus Roizmanbacteria ba